MSDTYSPAIPAPAPTPWRVNWAMPKVAADLLPEDKLRDLRAKGLGSDHLEAV